MKQVKKSVLLEYTPHEIYGLVTDVRAYPQFLPWCEHAEVTEERPDGTTARLYLSYFGVRQSFTTRNTNVSDRSVSMQLVDGPFSQLDGQWRFEPVPAAAGADARACRVEFELAYGFSNMMLELMISPAFDRIADTFVESFVKRAAQVHGVR